MPQIIKKYAVLICFIIAVMLMVIATLVYPGGSLPDKNSTGFDWSKNFICNLFSANAINGLENPSRIWALIGMAFYSIAFGIFFISSSKKLPSRHASNVLKYIGAANILFTFLIATSLHDLMVTIASTLFLMGLFYITVFILMTRLHWLKFSCIICMLTIYFTLYLYGTGNWELLAIMQKVSLISSMFLALGIKHFTRKDDFIRIQPMEQNTEAMNR